MTEPICKVADIIYVRFELKEFEEQKKYLHHFGMMLAHEDENGIFFRGTGTSPYIYVATKGDENKYIGTAYKANDYSDLEALSKEFNVDIVENTEPGGGHKVTLTDPDGIEVEVCHGMNQAEPVAVVSKVLNTGQSKARERNVVQRFGNAADEWQLKGDKWVYELSSKVKRLGHTAINCRDPKASVDWYANTIGFLVSDNLVAPDGNSMGAFMRCNQGDKPVDHHTINNIALPGDGYPGPYGHAGYEVSDSVDDLMAGHYHLKTNGEYFHEWGIGRHLLGSQMYDYWRDPHGFTHEHWTDGDLIDASVPANDVSLFEFGKAQYGPPPPATFGHSMPIEEVNKVRAEVPDLYEGVLKDLAKMQKEMEKEDD